MLGLMQQLPLTTGSLIDHAARQHGFATVISRDAGGTLVRTTWAALADRTRRAASALQALGAEQGDVIATLAWNRTPHLELYYAVSASGMVLHTVNPRLFPEQLRFVIENGGARFLCVDPDLLPMVEPLLPSLPRIERVIVLCGSDTLPDSTITGLLAYEDLVAATEPLPAWPDFDENTAASLCYTSGTTGDPKGCLYSHRSIVLHAMALCAADSMALSATDAILLLPPMFHVNAWGVPFAAAMVGAKLVLPGNRMDGASLHGLLSDEGITFSLGVPTVWFTLLDHIAATTGADERASLKLNRVFMGGAATPRTLVERFRDLLGVETMQAWGMTETSPVAAVCRPLRHQVDLEPEAALDLRAKAGRGVFGVDFRVEGEDGLTRTHGDPDAGLLKVRGHWVISAYYRKVPGSALDAEGFMDTGDVGWIDDDGFINITDRAKDVIKSGGEWISSIELENAAASHPAVAEAAVVGVPHPRWQERPLLFVRLHPNRDVQVDEMREHLAVQVARWCLPDAMIVLDDIPHTASGKVQKHVLRARFRDYLATSS